MGSHACLASSSRSPPDPNACGAGELESEDEVREVKSAKDKAWEGMKVDVSGEG